MEIREAKIEVAEKRVPRQPIIIAPIGDIHYGVSSHAAKGYNDHIEYVTGIGKNVYYLGLGDMIDFMSESQRRILRNSDYRTTTREIIDSMTRDHVMEFCELIKKSKGKWLGMLSGNHMYEFLDGTNSDQMICREMDAPYLGHCAFLKIEFTSKASDNSDRDVKTRGSIVIWMHHGKGSSGVTVGAVLNRLQRMAGAFDADVYVMGHLHKVAYAPITYLKLQGLSIQNRTKHLVSTGGFLKGYEEFSKVNGVPTGNYIERASMLPNAIGSPVIKVWPKIDARGMFVPEIVVEGGSFSVPQ